MFVTITGGANITSALDNLLYYNLNWNNGRDPYVRNLLTWVFCNKLQRLVDTFRNTPKANIVFMEPFLAPDRLNYISSYYNWNNGFQPGEYWSLKDHKWSFAMCYYWPSIFYNISGFAGDFAGIRAPGTTDCRYAFRNCSNFNSDLTDMILSWQSTNILIRDMISGSGLSLENYSKFLIAIKQSYDNNNSRFNYDNFGWNINQYYNSSASSARNALEAAFPGKITDLGINYLDPNTYSRNVQTFQYSGTFIMSMNDASWDGSPPLSNGYDTDSNITYTITTSSSEGTTTVYVAYQYINTFDPTSNTTVPGLRLNGKSYFVDNINSNFTIIQFDYIPLDINQGQLRRSGGDGISYITILANDQPYIQKNTSLDSFYRPGKTLPKENYEWVGRLDTTNCIRINECLYHAYRNNTNLNGWNVNNDVTMETLLAAYNALEKMVELGYNPLSYDNQNFPDVPELQIYRAMYPNISTNGVTITGGANIIQPCNESLRDNFDWNNGRDPYVPNLLTWVFCNKNQTMGRTFLGNPNANIVFMEPFLAPKTMRIPFTSYTDWNNGFEPGEYWSLKDHKWSFAMCDYWPSMLYNKSGFAGDFAGIRAPATTACRRAFENCSNFNSDLTDMILSWQSTNIDIEDMITGSGLSVENYSKFLIAIKQSYDNNNSRFNYDLFTWNINQYYNSSASSARNALEAAFPGKITDLGLQ
jgi:hypothetical protein